MCLYMLVLFTILSGRHTQQCMFKVSLSSLSNTTDVMRHMLEVGGRERDREISSPSPEDYADQQMVVIGLQMPHQQDPVTHKACVNKIVIINK